MSRELGIALLAILFGLVVITVGPALVSSSGDVQPTDVQRQVDEPAPPPGTAIAVPGSGTVTAEPDQAVLRLAAIATASDAANATSRLATNASSLRTALADRGADPDRIQTVDFRVSVLEPDPPRRNRTLYRAVQLFEVTLPDTARAGEVVDAAVANGTSEVRSVTFELADETSRELREQAIQRAMDEARQAAETAAARENLSIRRVDRIGVSWPQDGVVPLTRAETAAGTTIEPRPVTVRADVQVTYNATD